MNAQIPRFGDLGDFLKWWNSPQGEQIRRDNPSIFEHPHVKPWLDGLLAEESEKSPSRQETQKPHPAPMTLEYTPSRLRVVCPGCGVAYYFKPRYFGHRVRCRCGTILNIPTSTAPPHRTNYEDATLRMGAPHQEVRKPIEQPQTDAAATPSSIPTKTKPRTSPVADSEQTTESQGKVFANRYRVVRRLGAGGMGVVYYAYDEVLDIPVALKVLRHEDLAGRKEVKRFMREAQEAAKLNHPNIVRVYNAGFDEQGRPFIAMQYVEGWSLAQVLAARKKGKRSNAPRMGDKELLRVFVQVAEALAYAHRQHPPVVHRDIKPANVMVDRNGHAYLMDFGLAKQVRGRGRSKSLTVSGAVLGTPAYMSPEQAEGKSAQVRPASDVFSFGVMLYEAFCGRLPFEGDNVWQVLAAVMRSEPPLPRQLRRNIHPDLDAIITKCLEKDPRRRYQNAGELLADLKRHIAGEPVSARPLSGFGLLMRKMKRRAGIIAAITAIFLIAIIAGVVIAIQRGREQQKAQKARIQAEKLLKDASRAFREGNLEKALELVNQSLGRCPSEKGHRLKKQIKAVITKRAEALLKRAREALESGALKEALELVNRSIAVRELPDAAKLRQQIKRRLKEEEQKAQAKAKLGEIMAEALTAEPEKAVKIFKKLLKGALAKEAKVWLEYGRALQKCGRPENALIAWQKCLTLTKDKNILCKAHFEIGVQYLLKELTDQELWEKARNHLKKVIQLSKPSSPERLLAEACMLWRQWDEVETKLRNVLKRFPGHPLATYYLGFALREKALAQANRKQRDALLDEAIDLLMMALGFMKQIRNRTRVAFCYNSRGIAWYHKGDYDKAIADFTKAIELKPDDAEAFNNRGNAWRGKGENDKAIVDFTKAIELKPRFAAAFYNRGNAWAHKGDYDKAIADYTKAIELNPKLVGAHINRGIAWAYKGDHARAIADLTKAIELNPRYAGAYYNRGLAKAGKGDFDGAIADLTKAVELAPRFWQAWLGLAGAYSAKRQKQKCLEALRKLLRLNPSLKAKVRNDAPFRWLRDDPEFKRLTGQ